MNSNGFTATQKAILDVLADGGHHNINEVRGCLSDDQAPTSAVYFHISRIRVKLKDSGQGISYIRNGSDSYYQLVRMMTSPYR